MIHAAMAVIHAGGRRRRSAWVTTVPALAWLVAGCGTTSTVRLIDYYDTRQFATINLTGTVAHPEAGTRLYGFTDHGPGEQGPHYLELQLSQPVYRGVGVITEYNREFKSPRGTNRLGFVYQPPLPAAFRRDRLAFKATPWSTHEFGTQLGMSASKGLGSNAYLEGYFEYNTAPDKVVTEWQFGYRLRGPVFAVGEFRHSGIKAKTTGVAFGVEWKVR
jgi:hypothetical protein